MYNACVIDDFAADHREHGLCLGQVGERHGKDVLREHGEVGEFAGLQGELGLAVLR